MKAHLVRLQLIFWVLLGCACIVVAGVHFADGEWVEGVVNAALGWVFVNLMSLRRNWIIVGYWRGKASVYESLDEGARRGLSYDEWLTAEQERVAGVIEIKRKEEP